MKRRRFWFPVGTLLILAIAIVLFTDITGIEILDGLPKIRFQKTTVRTASTVELEGVRDLYAFNTVAYVHRAVFPFDYLPEDVSINTVLQKLRTTELSVKETLSEDEYLYFQTFNLAADIGIGLGTRDRDFVVVTVVVNAGFDLAGTPLENPQMTSENERSEFFQIATYETETGSTGRRAILSLPAPVITSVVVEDLNTEDYAYPDVAIGAEGWRLIAEFVESRLLESSRIDELLETAGKNGEEFVLSMLMQAGYDEVLFR